MTATTLARRWFTALADAPATRPGSMYLAADDESRSPSGCTCRGVRHALGLQDRMGVTTALQVARDRGQQELVTFLSARMERCSSTNPTPEQLAFRAAADLRNAQKELSMDALFEMELPPGAELAPDFKSWVAEVRPAFERAALSGEVFTTYSVARANDLPEPPDTAHHWGLLTMRLHAEGLIRPVRFDAAKRGPSHASSLKTWQGVTARIGSAA